MQTKFLTVSRAYKNIRFIPLLIPLIFTIIIFCSDPDLWYIAMLTTLIFSFILIVFEQKLTDRIILTSDKIIFKRLGITIRTIPVTELHFNFGRISKGFDNVFCGIIFCNDEKERCSMSADIMYEKTKSFYCCITQDLLESLYEFYKLPIKTELFKKTFQDLNKKELKQIELVEKYNLKLKPTSSDLN